MLPDDLTLDFRYVRRRTWLPTRGRGTRTGVARDIVEVGTAVLREVSEADAPIVLSLSRPEGEIAFRMVDGVLMRPLRKESSWEPMDVAYLAHGLGKGGRAIDLPLRNVSASWHSVTGGDVGRSPDNDNGTWLADEPDDNLLDAIQELSVLAVIDGVVHAPTPVPELRLITYSERYLDPPTMTLSWTSTDLCEDQELTTGKMQERYALPLPGAETTDHGRFTLDREEDAHALGLDWARRMGMPYERREIVPHVDAGMLGLDHDVDGAAPLFAELVRGFDRDAWNGLHFHDRAVVTDWLDLRDDVARVAGSPTPEDVRGCLDAAAGLVDRMFGTEASLSVGAVVRLASRWRVVEAHRGIGTAPDVTDPGLTNMASF